jgi:hypothetical protein
MPLTNQCNVCRKNLSEQEKESAKLANLMPLCWQHLAELKTKLKKWAPLFQKMNLS